MSENYGKLLLVKLLASPTVISAAVDGEVVLLDAKSGDYFGLNPVAARAWTLLTEEYDTKAVHARLLQEFDVDADVLARDLSVLWTELGSARLVTPAEGERHE
jgi:hypothetical protein